MTLDEVRRLFSEPKFVKDYGDWLNDPMTKKVMEAASVLAEPPSLQRPDPNAALYIHGVFVGFNRMLSFVRSADEALSSVEEAQVEESYGQEKILSEMYPQIKQARTRSVRAKTTKKAPTA